MMTILESKGLSEQFGLDRVAVEVYQQRPEDPPNHAEQIFVEINKAEPVKLVDLPGVATRKDRDIISNGAESIMEKYPEMFKPSQLCRPPHLNLDNLRDNIFGADILKRHGLTTAKKLEKWLLEQNELLFQKYKDANAEDLGVSRTSLEKAQRYGFYLGLDKTWYYN
jgi:hypothetical protein